MSYERKPNFKYASEEERRLVRLIFDFDKLKNAVKTMIAARKIFLKDTKDFENRNEYNKAIKVLEDLTEVKQQALKFNYKNLAR